MRVPRWSPSPRSLLRRPSSSSRAGRTRRRTSPSSGRSRPGRQRSTRARRSTRRTSTARYYAAKAPGLGDVHSAVVRVARAVGLQDAPLSTGDGYRNRVWELNLFGAVLPMLALLAPDARGRPSASCPATGCRGRAARGRDAPAAVRDACSSITCSRRPSASRHSPPSSSRGSGRRRRGGSPRRACSPVSRSSSSSPRDRRPSCSAVCRSPGSGRSRRVLGLCGRPPRRCRAAPRLQHVGFGSPLTLGYTNALKAAGRRRRRPSSARTTSGFYGVGLPRSARRPLAVRVREGAARS